VYQLPLVVFFSSPTLFATCYYATQQTNATTNAPLNMGSNQGTSLNITADTTLRLFCLTPGLRESNVITATYRVNQATNPPNPPSGSPKLLIPFYAVIAIVGGGVLIIAVVVIAVIVVRVKNRNKLVAIRLEASEYLAKENHYRALYAYTPGSRGELELKVGDVIRVTATLADGWWEGASYRLKGQSGIFPGSYCERIHPERLMWTERPKTVIGRLSRRVSNFFSGSPQYGMDPQAAPQSRFSQRVSRAFRMSRVSYDVMALSQ